MATKTAANIEARLLQAQVWLTKGESKKAVENLERLDTAYPKLPLVKHSMARAYLLNNNAAQAAVVLNHVLTEHPDNAGALLLLGEANLRSGNAQQVVAPILELLEKSPDLTPAQLLQESAQKLMPSNCSGKARQRGHWIPNIFTIWDVSPESQR